MGGADASRPGARRSARRPASGLRRAAVHPAVPARRRVRRRGGQRDHARRAAPRLGPGRKRRLPRAAGDPREAERTARQRLHGGDPAVPAPGRVPVADARVRADVEERMTLPPGQRAIDGFPRFGTHLHRRPPAIPSDPAIDICGAVKDPFSLPVTDLAKLPRREQVADFHCVAGWTATSLRWEGVAFEAFYRAIVEPSLAPDASVTHLGFVGLDGYRSIVTIEDALSDDVLIAQHLDGRPLDSDHGAPLRLSARGSTASSARS